MQYKKVVTTKQKIGLCSIFFAVFTLFTTTQARASSFDLSLTPQIFQIELTPPAIATTKKTVILENKSDDSLSLHIEYHFFKPKDDNGDIEYLKSDEHLGNNPDILDRVTISSDGQPITSLVIPPKTKRELDLTVNVPKDEPPGDYYFSVLFLADNSSTKILPQGAATSAIGGVAMNILLSIGPKSKTRGTIEEFSTPFFVTKGPVIFKVKIKNTSSHFIYPKGQIIISNMFGQKIGKIDLLPLNILSNSSRSLPSKEQFAQLQLVQDVKTAKTKDAEEKLKKFGNIPALNSAVALWPVSFLLGPYKANLTIALSDEGPLYVRSIHFIGLPIYVFSAFVITLLLIFAIKNRLHHRSRQRHSASSYDD